MNLPTTAGAAELRHLGRLFLLGTLLGLPGPGRAQPPAASPAGTPATATALHYRDRTGSTVIAFKGTALLPEAHGSARVVPRSGGILRIRAKFEGLPPASRFGGEYLTYVLWAVTPAGHPANLGEVGVRRNGRANLEVDTNLQTFGLLVTAEPYFAVAQASSLVVLENAVTRDTRGRVEEVEAHYELLPRGAYLLGLSPVGPAPGPRDRKVSPYVYQAGNALRIARAEGAEQEAPAEFQRAADLLTQVEAEKKKWKPPAVSLARQAVQQAEDARLIAVKRREEAALAQARQAAEASERARLQAEADARTAQDETERVKRQAEQEAAQAREQATLEVSSEKLQARRRLRERMSQLLETRETERGLAVSLSDLLFPSGKAALLPATRLKLAKVAGVLLTYPRVRVSVEGHADATGRPALNQRLSLRRAQAVRDFLVRQGVPSGACSAAGFGSARPLASNADPAGRQQNRRVELLLAGDVIGF
jgi:outer membrane protein OmpA-like peptidoglycan-associated protein